MLVSRLSTGMAGQISWQRLAQLFKESGETTNEEKIVEFEASKDFLRFKVESK